MSYGCYSPRPALDVWAFGLLLLSLAGGKRPIDHIAAMAKTAELEEQKDEYDSNEEDDSDDEDEPDMDLQYLANLMASGVSYADQVGLLDISISRFVSSWSVDIAGCFPVCTGLVCAKPA